MSTDLNTVRELATRSLEARAAAQPDLWDDITAVVMKHNPAVPPAQARERAWAMVWAGWQAAGASHIKARAVG